MTVLPPYAALLGLTLASDEDGDGDGAPVLTMPFGDDVLGRPGFLHGGAIAGLLEMAALAALRRALGDDGTGIAPLTLTTDYRRGGRDAPTRAAGTVTRLGARIAHVEAAAWQDDRSRPIATARTSWLLARPA